jgi:magnesium chelatase accessory protein
MRWPEDAEGWPMAEQSRFVLNRPHRWHVQESGTGPVVLLIHGAGGAAQSWRGVFPLLAEVAHVVAVDLPGQGFTQSGARMRCGLDHMAEDLWSLCRHEGWAPAVIVGHSAGAAIALRMAEMGATGHVVGINAALGKFRGVAGWLFPFLARALALSPLTAGLFAATVTEASVRGLIRGTGSVIDDAGVGLYRRLASDRGHVDGTLAMMAQWRLDGLIERLPQNPAEVVLILGTGDLAVPPATSREAAGRMRAARVVELPGRGHLAHEEDPAAVVAVIEAELERAGRA